MKISLSDKFRKNYKKRIFPNSPIENKYKERSAIFLNDPRSPIVKDHALKGKLLGLRAFWITGDVRVVYFAESKDLVTFVDIGSHNQVYS